MLQRVFLILAILAGVGVIVVSQTKLRDHIQGIISERNTNKTNWDKEKARANKAEKDHAATQGTLANVRKQLDNTKSELANTKSSLDNTTGERDKALQNLEKAVADEKAARQDLFVWRSLSVTPAQVKAMIEDLNKAKETLVVTHEENKVLGRRVAQLQAKIDIILSPDPDEFVVPLPPGLKGKILVVDPKWEFVVLDIGEKQGVLKDGVLLVHRDSKLVGKVKISSVMPDRCIANIIAGWKLGDIREGDQVLF